MAKKRDKLSKTILDKIRLRDSWNESELINYFKEILPKKMGKVILKTIFSYTKKQYFDFPYTLIEIKPIITHCEEPIGDGVEMMHIANIDLKVSYDFDMPALYFGFRNRNDMAKLIYNAFKLAIETQFGNYFMFIDIENKPSEVGFRGELIVHMR